MERAQALLISLAASAPGPFLCAQIQTCLIVSVCAPFNLRVRGVCLCVCVCVCVCCALVCVCVCLCCVLVPGYAVGCERVSVGTCVGCVSVCQCVCRRVRERVCESVCGCVRLKKFLLRQKVLRNMKGQS